MKILHTADWHAGRVLHGVDRTDEVREALSEVALLAQEEQVDVVLVAGDLFDKKTPSAAAEDAVYEFFMKLGVAGIPSVVIAGNHDSAARLDAVAELLSLANVHVFGSLRQTLESPTLYIENASGETACFAPVPFVSERRIVQAADLLNSDPGKWRSKYQEGMRDIVGHLSRPFSGDTINLLMMHTAMNGAELSNSEYEFHCTESYSLSPGMFPPQTNYVALGHIHKPQDIKQTALPARYVGSLLQLDFGEQGDPKFVDIVEVTKGRPSELLKRHEIQAGKRLKRVNLSFDGLERQSEELKAFDGWLKLHIALESPKPGLKDRLMANMPNVLAVVLEVAQEMPEEATGVDINTISMTEAFSQYYLDDRGSAVPEKLLSAFSDLYERSFEEGVGDEV